MPNISGAIIDHIVNDIKSPFFRDTFSYTRPIIDTQGDLKGRILGSDNDKREGDSLSIDIDSVILTVKTPNLDKALSTIKEHYLPYIKKEIFEKFDIHDINREGLIFDFELDNPKLGDKILTKATNNIFSNAALFDFKFAEKQTDQLSFVLKEYFDYQNHIISIKNDESCVALKYDFQIYFRPEVERIGDLDLDKFVISGKDALESRFFNFLKSYESKEKS
jgi:hypothetical protein